MNNDLTNNTEDETTLAEQISKISNISKKLNETIQQRKTFGDLLITALSDMVCDFISRGTIDRMPEEFRVLTQKADDYMLYQAETEEDRDFLVNCARVYQITNMVKRINIENKYRIATTEQAAAKYMKYYKVLSVIDSMPYPSHKYLCEKTGLSALQLSRIVKKLEKDQLLISWGKWGSYRLTRIGREICDKLTKEMR